jgi:hypothetical protein
VVALIAVTVASDTHGDKGKSVPLGRSFVATRSGIAVRYPVGWRVTTHNDTFVPNPALCLTLRARGGPVSSHATVRLVEYLPPALDRSDLGRRDSVTGDPLYPYRARHVLLSMFQPADNSWTTGKTLDFQDHGRVFYIGVELPRRAGGETSRSVEAVIDSIRVQHQGRCRPTSGVGSVRYYKRLARHLRRRPQSK